MILKIKNQSFIIGLFVIIVFILSRQVPFYFLSPIMNICSLLLIIFYFYGNRIINSNHPQINFQLTKGILVLLALHIIYSLIVSNGEITTVLRFAIILFVLIVAFQINNLPQICLKIFLLFQIIQSLLIVLFEIYLLVYSDELTSGVIRNFVITEGWGDIYSNGLFYHVQLRGNSLLPFAYMILSIPGLKLRRQWAIKTLIILGNIFAGNFAFILIIIVFVIFNSILKIKNSKTFFKWLIFVIVSIIFLSLPIINMIQSKIESKMEGNSISERYEQTKLLINSLAKNELTFFCGNGLGYSLDVVTQTRDYRGAIYFEIQPLYFLSQMGVIFFAIFLSFSFFIAFVNYRNKQLFLIFCCYWLYASINPYIFDTNHFIVVIILNILNRREVNSI